MFVVITLPAELIVHSIIAREYYYLNVKNLRLVALTAAKTGAQYLPAEPRAAVRIANAYAEGHGIAPAEVFTEISSDDNVLTVRIDRKIPVYVAVLALGLPARDINVTASASPHRSGRPFGTQILDVPAVKSSRLKSKTSVSSQLGR